MSSVYCRLEKSLHIPNAWAISVPLASAKLVMSRRQVQRAVAHVFVDVARGRVYLVLWVGVDPRWITRKVIRLLTEHDAAPDSAESMESPKAIPSTHRAAPRRHNWEPMAIPTGALAC